MKRFTGCLLAGLFLLIYLPPAQGADDKDKQMVDRVNTAIDRGVKFLRAQRKDNGTWEMGGDSTLRPGGWTSLVLLALLNSGVKPDDALITKGLEFLRKIEPDQTYVVGLQTMVYAAAGYEQDLERIQKNVDWLVNARIADGKKRGWTYRAVGGMPDNSNTQYALLGLHEGFVAGASIKPEVWEWIREFYMDSQIGDGSYRYRDSWQPSLSMTTAGLSGLLITSMDLNTTRPCPVKRPCGKYDEDTKVKRSLEWIGDRLPTKAQDFTRLQHLYYNLYGIERAGRLSGHRFLGPHDWYRIGCDFLVQEQQLDGSWRGNDPSPDSQPVLATSFALLFLSKGRTPVLISKLAHGPDDSDDWNNDRYDVRNLVDFASKELFKKQPLAWQVFDIRGPLKQNNRPQMKDLAAELLQSPIVFLNGHNDPDLERTGGILSPEGELLREYAENGGFIFVEACCGREAFNQKFLKQVGLLFPESRLEELGDDHPIWNASVKFHSSPRKFKLYGIQQGCRTMLVYSPQDLSCYWEAFPAINNRDIHKAYESNADARAAFELGANVIAYATGLEPPEYRGTKKEVIDAGAKGMAPPRGSLQVAQLRYPGAWQPAPNAMRNLMLALKGRGLNNVELKTEPIRITSEDVKRWKFLYLHGRGKISYNREDLDKLRFNLENGGLLLADACCGSRQFDESFRQFMTDLWADSKVRPLPKLERIALDDVLFSQKLNGEIIQHVQCRRLGPDGKTVQPGFLTVEPELEGIKINGRWAVIYSKYDIGCALEKNKSADCLGHDPNSAKRLATAAVLYALNR